MNNTSFLLVDGKAALMEENGRRATALLNGIQPYAQKVPAGGALLLVNAKDGQPEYSVFLMNDFNVLNNGEARIRKTVGRDDITVRIVDEENLNAGDRDDRSVVVYFDDFDDDLLQLAR